VNPRQRRGVLLVALAVLGAIGVIAALAAFVADVRSEVDPKVAVLVLERDVSSYEPIAADDVSVAEVPEKWAPEGALSDVISVDGRVATSDLPANTYLQEGMLIPAPAGSENEREVAIRVDAATGVAGRIEPGDYVDIAATFAATDEHPDQARVVVPAARVVAVGLPAEVQSETPGGVLATEEVLPVTFAVSAGESVRITHAESFAETVRLLLTSPEAGVFPKDKRVYELGAEGPRYLSGEE
jgi:pilus assembly protein CpaB